ncbi:MAG: RluA family pseudouridine synthase, partial [Bdellovibrionales bacterium]|nr:RluA family pseudouridine synthase [Bdellovibrionales bacterium]
PKYPYRKAEDFYPSFSTKSIVYEDDHFAVVFKPIGLPTHPNKEQTAHSLRTYLERYYRRRVHLPSRLDTATCGLVPVSIHGMMHQQLQRLFERRLVEKCYLCGVDSPPPADHFCVDAPIRRSAIHAVLREVGEPGGDPAETHFEFLNAVEGRSGTTYYLHAYPVTGRTHQIRVHLASFVGPIRGDRFYGGPPAEELHLMCSKLSLFHPVLKKQITVVAPRRLLPEWAKAAEIVAS